MSVVEYAGIERKQGHLYLKLRNVDLLDGTPVLDIKPYVAYVDALPQAHSGFAEEAPRHLPVRFSAHAQQRCEEVREHFPLLAELIEQMLRLDPRPAYQQDAGRRYGIHLHAFNVVWHFDGDSMIVDDIEDV